MDWFYGIICSRIGLNQNHTVISRKKTIFYYLSKKYEKIVKRVKKD